MSRLKILICVCLFLFLGASNALAKDGKVVYSLALVGMSMDYKEYDTNGQLLDSEESSFTELTGTQIGIGYAFLKDISSYSIIKLNFMILRGQTQYKGSILGSGQAYGSLVSTTQNTIIDTDLSYKHIDIFNDFFKLSYGLGIGYREWERSLSASQVEVYKWYSIRPMLGVGIRVNEKLNIDSLIEYQYGINPIMTSSNPNLDFELGSADILELSFPVTYKYNKNLDFFVEAVFQKQTITRSNVNSGFYEPDSTAYNNYLKLGLTFNY